MKKCMYCAEVIQDDAIKCKHCGEFFNQKITPAPALEPLPIESPKPISYIPLGIMCMAVFIPIGVNIAKHFSLWFRQRTTLETVSMHATYYAIVTGLLVILFALGGWIVGKNIIKYLNENMSLSRAKKVLAAWMCAVVILIGTLFISGMTAPTRYLSTGYHASMDSEEAKKIIDARAIEIFRSSMNASKGNSAAQISDPQYVGTFTPEELKARMGLARQKAKEEYEKELGSKTIWTILSP